MNLPSLHAISRLFVSFSLLALLGCTPSYMLDETERYGRNLQIIDKYTLDRQHKWVLGRDSSFYIVSNPAEKSRYAQLKLGSALKEAFDTAFTQVVPAIKPESLNEARKSAQAMKLDYLLSSELLIWDQSVNDWRPYDHKIIPKAQPVDDQQNLMALKTWKGGRTSAKTVEHSETHNQLLLRLKIIEVLSNKQVDFITVKTHAGFLTDTSKRPLDALNPPLQQLAKELVGRS